MTSDNPLLDRVRKLLAKAEAEGVTIPEAESLTAKATVLMARYGIDRAMLAATKPESDKPGDRIISLPNPWSDVHAHLLSGIAAAMRCRCVQLRAAGGGRRIHVFGYASDLERAEILFTSLLIQMAHGLAAATVPAFARSPRAWRRSWLLGFATAVIARVRAAEHNAATQTGQQQDTKRPGVELVLADRALVISRHAEQAYPHTRKTRVTYSGTGYGDGYAKGKTADIGSARIQPAAARTLPRGGR